MKTRKQSDKQEAYRPSSSCNHTDPSTAQVEIGTEEGNTNIQSFLDKVDQDALPFHRRAPGHNKTHRCCETKQNRDKCGYLKVLNFVAFQYNQDGQIDIVSDKTGNSNEHNDSDEVHRANSNITISSIKTDTELEYDDPESVALLDDQRSK